MRESSIRVESALNFIRDLFVLEPLSSTMDEFTHTSRISIPPPPPGSEGIVACECTSHPSNVKKIELPICLLVDLFEMTSNTLIRDNLKLPLVKPI